LRDQLSLAGQEREVYVRELRKIIFTATAELYDLVSIYKALAGGNDSLYLQRLRDVLSGPELSVDESIKAASNRARNIGFELMLTARISSHGGLIDSASDADIAVIHNSKQYFIECKRAQSVPNVRKLLGVASDQLQRHYEKSTNVHAKGAIFVDISKACNPDSIIYPCHGQGEVDKTLQSQCEEVASSILKSMSAPAPSKTLGEHLWNRQTFLLAGSSKTDLIVSELLATCLTQPGQDNFATLYGIGSLTRPPERYVTRATMCERR